MGMRTTIVYILAALPFTAMPQEHKTPPTSRGWLRNAVRWGSVACVCVLLFAWAWSISSSLTVVYNARTVTWFAGQLCIETSQLWAKRWSVGTASYSSSNGGYYGFRFGKECTFGYCAIGSKDAIVIPVWCVLVPVGVATWVAWRKPKPTL